MSEASTIVVVGAGRFAANYLSVLTVLGRRMPADVPPIGRVVVTRTTREAAEETAAAWRRGAGPGFDVVAAAVTSDTQLESVLDRWRPRLTCITARDSVIGDTIHARYAAMALPHGAVLTEKNFAAVGEGSSAGTLAALADHPNAHLLGMELPMAPLREAMAARGPIERAFAAAEEIRFHWETPRVTAAGLVEDLALHPWSLLPERVAVRVAGVQAGNGGVDIRLELTPTATCRATACRIRLQPGNRRRTMHIGDLGVGFIFAEGYLKAVPLSEAGAARYTTRVPRALCRTPDPLRQHILAALRGTPLVGIAAIERSQRFLEQLAGYRPEGQRTDDR